MARPKKPVDIIGVEYEFAGMPSNAEVPVELTESSNSHIVPLSIDYPNEGLNDMARKINEIIVKIHAL